MATRAEDFLDAESFLDGDTGSGSAAGFLDAESFLDGPEEPRRLAPGDITAMQFGVARPSQGRLKSGLSSLAQGAGQSISGLPKSLALLNAPDPFVLRNLERIDRGQPYVLRFQPGALGPGGRPPSEDPNEALYREYQAASPEQRQAIRARWDEQYNRAVESPLFEAGNAIDRWIAEHFPVNPQFQDEFWTSKVPQALGSATGFAATALIGRGALRPLGSTARTVGTFAVPAELGSAMNRIQTFEDALNSGSDIATALEASKVGALIGTSEAIPIGHLLTRLDKVSGGAIKRMLVRAIQQGTEEGLQETFSGILNEAVAQRMYDPTRGIWTLDRAEEGAVGFTTGALLEVLATIALPGRRRGAGGATAPEAEQHTPEEVTTFARDRLASLEAMGEDVTEAQADERDFLRQNPTPRQVAETYGVQLREPQSSREQARANVPSPSPADIESPLPTDLIQEGKEVIEEALASQGSDEEIAGLADELRPFKSPDSVTIASERPDVAANLARITDRLREIGREDIVQMSRQELDTAFPPRAQTPQPTEVKTDVRETQPIEAPQGQEAQAEGAAPRADAEGAAGPVLSAEELLEDATEPPARETASLDERLDAFADERQAMRDRGETDSPIYDAMGAATLPGFSLENAQKAVITAIEQGRDDLADAIIERAERSAEKAAQAKPGVSPDSPKYEAIKESLEQRAREAREQANQLRRLAELRRGERGQPTEPVTVREATEPAGPAVPTPEAQLPAVATPESEMIAQTIESQTALPSPTTEAPRLQGPDEGAPLADMGFRYVEASRAWAKTVRESENREHLFNVRHLRDGRWRVTQSTRFPGTSVTGTPARLVGEFANAQQAAEAVGRATSSPQQQPDPAPRGTTPAPQEIPETAKSGNPDAAAAPPLRVEDFKEKSIIIRGQTKENIERIKAAGKAAGIRALWNRKAGGWIFPKAREAQVREALADLLQGQSAAGQGLRGRRIDDEWVRFAPDSGTLNIPRDDMPQIKAEHRGALANFLKARGIDGTEADVPASSLKPTQAEFSEKKVEKAKAFTGGDRAILVSSDGYVLDGHHQWMAAVDRGDEIRIIQLDAPIRRLLEVVPEFPSAEGGTPATDPELTISFGSTPISGPGARQPSAGRIIDLLPGLSERLLSRASNMFGRLDDEIRARLRAVLERPTDETWDDAYSIIIDERGGPGRGLGGTTLWNAWIAVDPEAPRSKPGDTWPRVPSKQDLIRAFQWALGEERSTGDDVRQSQAPGTTQPAAPSGVVDLDERRARRSPTRDELIEIGRAQAEAAGAYDLDDDELADLGQEIVDAAGFDAGAAPSLTFGEGEVVPFPERAPQEPETLPAPDTESGRLAQHFARAFADGRSFGAITEARREAAEVLGRPVNAGTAEAKLVDESVELGVVIRARAIVAEGGTPRAVYDALVDLYGRMPKLSTRTSTSVEQQAYSTPVPLAYLAARAAGITTESRVYEPTAGNGALLLPADPANVVANELNPDRAENLRATLPGATVESQDASEWTPDGDFDVVIANPPFGVVKDDAGETRRFQVNDRYETGEIDHAISLRALEAMADDGAAVLIVGSVAKTARTEDARSDAYNSKAKREFYLTLYGEYNVVDHYTVAGELYERQGAGWPVDVIVIRGRGPSSRKVPAADPPRIYRSWDELAEALDAQYPVAQGRTRPTDRGRARRPARPAASDERDRAGGGETRPRGQRGESAPGEPAGVRNGPLVRQPVDIGSLEPPSRELARPADSERPAERPRRNPVAGENIRQVAYTPSSRAAPMGTLVPVNMQTAVQNALDGLRTRVGDLDSFVAGKLQYPVDELGDYFGAEQVDALALALDNMDRGAGFIIGDQTGIGKGRVVAAVIRYALITGRTPIFTTEKPNLYGDMYRDLVDIGVPKMLGRPPKILMTNAGESVPLDEEGTVVLKTPGAATHNARLRQMAAKGRLDGYDMVFTTYSQMQTHKGEKTARMDFLEAMARGGLVIFDESHNAGGSTQRGRGGDEQKKANEPPNRAEFARLISRAAGGVFYSSATYAKRPDVMDLYATTDMRLAVADISKLADAIQRGGVPMQQVVAAMLSESGQYIRRERSFDGVVYNASLVQVSRDTYANYSRALAEIQRFSERVIPKIVKAIDKQLKAEGKSISPDGSTGGAGAKSTNFTSIMHNLIDQMLLSIKADTAAERAIEALRKGEKPVITVANTMGSFIDDYVEDAKVGPGDRVDLTFNSMLERYLDRTRRITIRRPFMKKGEKADYHYLTDEELGPQGLELFNQIRDMIREFDLSALPVSPIDHIRMRLQREGFKVGEITGRTATLDYRPDGSYYRVRPRKEVKIAGRRKAIADFNSGKIDAMILNQAGSTGLSLHASKTFKDQSKRRMIIAQAEKNIDTHMQMLGRVHRTGQVQPPEYDQLVADVPAEKRPAAVLAKKMASLNANTTASRGGALMAEDVPDFLNQYGDEVAARVMADMPEIHLALGEPLDGEDHVDAMRKVTGRIPLLPIEDQEMVYEVLEGEYRALLEQKEAAGESALEAKTLDLDAQVKSRRQVVAPTGENSPFADGVYVEVADVKRIGKPHPTAKVLEMVAESLGIPASDLSADNMEPAKRAGREAAERMHGETRNDFYAYRRALLDDLEGDKARAATEKKLDGQFARFQSFLRTAPVGQSVRVLTDAGNFYGVVTKIQRTGRARNPVALGSWKATIAMTDASKQITLPLSQVFTRETAPSGELGKSTVILERADNVMPGLSVIDAFDKFQTESRETRTIITGNILAGFDHVGGRGAIINFTDRAGGVRQGILMPKDFNYDKAKAEQPVEFRTAQQVLAFIGRGHKAYSADDAVVVSQAGDSVRIEVASSKARGGRYYLDKGVRRATGQDFVRVGDKMRVDVPRESASEALEELKRVGAAFRAIDELKVAREIAGNVGGSEREGDERFSLREQVLKQVGAVERDLKARLDQVGISDRIAVNLVKYIRRMSDQRVIEDAQGRYAARTIEVALSGNERWALDHEVIHALRDLGVIRPAEWRALSKAAQPRMDEIRRRYRGQKLSDESLVEEAVADTFADWSVGQRQARGFLRTAFDRIRDFLEALGNALRGNGFQSAGDVFRRIGRGEVGSRTGFPGEQPRDERGRFARVFHGSPYVFDEFSMESVGSGEGSRAFGHGLYFAENPDVAGSYRSANFAQLRAAAKAELGPGGSVREYQQLLERQGRKAGHLYEVEIPDDVVARMLDWDTPLSEQTAHIRSAAAELGFTQDTAPAATGRDLVAILQMRTGDPEAASKMLQERGIPGVKYFDSQSRTKGKGTRNIVLFDPSLITEVRRDGETVAPRFALRGSDFNPDRARKALAAGKQVTFDNPESERRWQDARRGAAGQETFVTRIRDRLTYIGQGFSRHFIHLPNTARFSPAREQLRKIEAAPQAAKEDVVRVLRDLTKGMSRADLDLFTRKVVLDDLSFEVEREHELPFGFTPEDVAREKAKVDAVLAGRRDLLRKVSIRNQKVREVSEALVEAGVLKRAQIKNPAYYRHQVLDYARAQVTYAKGTGKKLKTPHWARRMGSRLDINANLLEAEFEWMQKALTDIATARTIEWFKRSDYNLHDDVVAKAKAHNRALVNGLLKRDLKQNGFIKNGRETSPLNEEWRGFRQRIAIGLTKVREALEGGLMAEVPAEFMDTAANILDETRGERSIFPFLAWILDNDLPGSIGAAQAFKAINQRKAWLRAMLGEKYADPMKLDELVKRGFAPEGYTTWQPDEGNLLFTAKTIPEHTVDRMLERIAAEGAGAVTADELRGAIESVRSMMVVGGPKYQLIIPEELAATLNSIRDDHADGLFDALAATPLGLWKRWVLINPRRVLKYNLNNLSGDLDAIIAGNPRAVRKLPQAIRELYQVMLRGKTPSARYREAVERGVFDSGLTVQEIPDINYLSEFESLVNPPSPLREPGRSAATPFLKIWRKLQGFTWFRENWLRYAAYLDYVERLERGESMRKVGYGAANREMVDAIEDPKDRAALLARELVGDYGAISHFGKGIRRKVIPFYSWMEINTKRYWRFLSNAWDQGIAQGFRTTGIVGATLGVRTTAYLALRMAVLYGLVQLWNNLVMGDDEDKLSAEERARLHLNLGRGPDGEVRTLRFQGALSDFLAWFGFEQAVGVAQEIERGRASVGDMLKEIAKAPVNKVANGITPVITAPLEFLTGRSYWPDVFRPRLIRDRWRELAQLFSVENEYDVIFDRPSRGYTRSIEEAVIYKRDEGELAYNRMKGMAYDWLRREKGLAGSGDYQTPRSKALYDWRQAKKFGDRSAERKAYDRLGELGVTADDLQASVKRAHPLGSVPLKDRKAFLATLTRDERAMLDRAVEWYRETYLD